MSSTLSMEPSPEPLAMEMLIVVCGVLIVTNARSTLRCNLLTLTNPCYYSLSLTMLGKPMWVLSVSPQSMCLLLWCVCVFLSICGFLLVLPVCMCLYLCECIHYVCRCLRSPEESVRSLGAGVMGSFELLDTGAGNKTWVSGRAAPSH